jgi:carbamoyl-phosphate synthase large subunit
MSAARAEICLLVTCVGRRVELLQALRRAAEQLGIGLRIVGTDQSPTAPALGCADERVIVPTIGDAAYIGTLLDTARRTSANAILPTIDTDLLVLSQNREEFARLGCTALIAEPEVIRTCRDKIATYNFLRSRGIDTPATYSPDEIRAASPRTYPMFIKPRDGSASVHVFRLDDDADLDFYLRKLRDPIVQEFVDGVEHTLDVYVGLTGEPRCVVPRARWQVRGGEMSKGVVVKDREVMQAGRNVVRQLGPSVRGLVTLQCIVTPQRRIRFIEINPRFGGGAPLGIAAGANYPLWLLEELLGRTPAIAFDGFESGLCAARYDWAAFLPLGEDMQQRVVRPRNEYPKFDV